MRFSIILRGIWLFSIVKKFSLLLLHSFGGECIMPQPRPILESTQNRCILHGKHHHTIKSSLLTRHCVLVKFYIVQSCQRKKRETVLECGELHSKDNERKWKEKSASHRFLSFGQRDFEWVKALKNNKTNFMIQQEDIVASKHLKDRLGTGVGMWRFCLGSHLGHIFFKI